MTMEHLCPRRGENPAFPGLSSSDRWEPRDGILTCSYCGSIHPDALFAAIEAGTAVGPTDKSYKLYIDLPHPNPEGERIRGAANYKPNHGDWLEINKANEVEMVAKYGRSVELTESIPQRWVQIGKNGPHVHCKFYFQHLSNEQQAKFIDLVNSKKMIIGEPGHFYRLPFFASKVA